MLGVITGLMDEADLLSAPVHGVRVRCAGIGPVRARETALALVAEGCRGLVSFGIAGGLDPALAPGTVVLAERVVDGDGGAWDTDAPWRGHLAALAGNGVTLAGGTLTGSRRVVATPAAKQELGRRNGAVAVDMESGAVAQVAAEAGLPFLVVRAISDPAWTSVPRAAMKGVTPDGRRRPLGVVAALARRPGDLPGLLRLRRDSATALAALGRVAAVSGGVLAFDHVP